MPAPRSKSTKDKDALSSHDNSVPTGDETPNLITVDDVSYEADSMPDEIKALLRDLLRFNHEADELQYRLRQVQAAQQTYYETIKAQLIEKGVKPV